MVYGAPLFSLKVGDWGAGWGSHNYQNTLYSSFSGLDVLLLGILSEYNSRTFWPSNQCQRALRRGVAKGRRNFLDRTRRCMWESSFDGPILLCSHRGREEASKFSESRYLTYCA